MEHEKELLVSIIIPIFNKETYINDCLRSIINQKYKEIEILLIDDGSVDRSGDICDKWQEKDSRIRVFHIPNGGVSRARNIGLSNASGSAVMFIDADDKLREDCLFEMVNAYVKENVKLVTCGFYKFESKYDSLEEYILLETCKYKMKEYLPILIKHDVNFYFNGPYAKLINKDIITQHKICFEPGHSYAEDFVFNMKLLNYTEEVYSLAKPLYYYRIDSEGSLSKVIQDPTYLVDRLDYMIELLEALIERYSIQSVCERWMKAFRNKITSIVMCDIVKNDNIGNKKEKILLLKKYITYYRNRGFCKLSLDASNRTKMLIILANRRMYGTIYHLIKMSYR